MDPMNGPLRLGVIPTLGPYLIPHLLPGTGSLPGDSVLSRPFAPPMPTRTIGLAWRRNFPRESTIRAVGAWIGEQLPPEVEKVDAVGSESAGGAPSAASALRCAEALSAQSL